MTEETEAAAEAAPRASDITLNTRLASFASPTPQTVDDDERTVDVVMSTGAPVNRSDYEGDYIEALSLDRGAVRLDRLNRGAPLLDSHRYWGGTQAMLGAVVPGSARIEGGELRGKVKFSRSESGDRAYQDMKDGVLRHVSIGYITHKFAVDNTTSPPTRRATDWEPHELSAVPIPADPQAGFRSVTINRAPPAKEDKHMTTESEAAAAAVETRAAPALDQRAIDAAVAAGVKTEMDRREAIQDIATRLGLGVEFANTHISAGASLDAVRAAAIDAKAKAETAAGGPANSVNVSRDERGSPWILPASALKTPEPGQRAAQMVLAIAAARRLGASPVDICARRFGADAVSTRALQASVGASGGYMIPIELSSELIDLLRPRTVVRRATPASRQISIPRGNLTIGRQNSGATVGYVGEGQSTAYTQETFGEINFSAKKAKAIVPISNDLIRFAQSSADMIVRDDLVQQLAVLEDQNFLRSAGSVYSPKGIRYLAASANILTATTSSYSVTTAIADLQGMVTALENAYIPMKNPAWFWSAKTKNWLYDARDSVGGFLFRDEMDRGRFRGIPYYWTQSIPNNLGGSSNYSEIYLVDMDEFIIADVPGLMIDASQDASYSSDGTTLTNSAFDRDETVIRIIAEHDCNIKHTASAAVLTSVPYGN